MERPVQREAEIISDRNYEGVSAARLVDEKITDVVRLTVAACAIVMESDGVDSSVIAKMRMRTFQILGVKERRN